MGIDTDEQDNCYVTGFMFGHYGGSQPRLGEDTQYVENRDRSFLSKINPKGEQLWTRSWRGQAFDVAVTPSGGIYVAGNIDRYSDLDPGPNEYLRNRSSWSKCSNFAFISIFTETGEFLKSHVGVPCSSVQTLTVDKNGDIYAVGNIEHKAFIAKIKGI